jgi:hypothetical protein
MLMTPAFASTRKITNIIPQQLGQLRRPRCYPLDSFIVSKERQGPSKNASPKQVWEQMETSKTPQTRASEIPSQRIIVFSWRSEVITPTTA